MAAQKAQTKVATAVEDSVGAAPAAGVQAGVQQGVLPAVGCEVAAGGGMVHPQARLVGVKERAAMVVGLKAEAPPRGAGEGGEAVAVVAVKEEELAVCAKEGLPEVKEAAAEGQLALLAGAVATAMQEVETAVAAPLAEVGLVVAARAAVATAAAARVAGEAGYTADAVGPAGHPSVWREVALAGGATAAGAEEAAAAGAAG